MRHIATALALMFAPLAYAGQALPPVPVPEPALTPYAAACCTEQAVDTFTLEQTIQVPEISYRTETRQVEVQVPRLRLAIANTGYGFAGYGLGYGHQAYSSYYGHTCYADGIHEAGDRTTARQARLAARRDYRLERQWIKQGTERDTNIGVTVGVNRRRGPARW